MLVLGCGMHRVLRRQLLVNCLNVRPHAFKPPLTPCTSGSCSAANRAKMADFDDLFQLPPLEPLRPANRDSAVLAGAPAASAQIVKPLPQLTTFSRRADGHQPPSAPTAARQQQQQHAPHNQQQQQRLLSARPAVAAPCGATQHRLPAPATQHQHHAKQLAQQGKPMARQPTLQQLFARAQCAGGRSKAETAQLHVPGAAGGASGHSGKENRKVLGLAEPWDELQEREADEVMDWKVDEVNDHGEKPDDGGGVEQQSSEEGWDEEDGDEDSSSAGEEDSEYHVSSEGSEEQEGDEDEDEEYGQGRGRSGKGKGGGVAGAGKRRVAVGGGRGRTQAHAPVTIDGSVDPATEQRGARPSPLMPLSKALLTVPSDAGQKPNAKPSTGEEASKVRLLGVLRCACTEEATCCSCLQMSNLASECITMTG